MHHSSNGTEHGHNTVPLCQIEVGDDRIGVCDDVPCDTITPRGCPVDPDVNINAARSLVSTGA